MTDTGREETRGALTLRMTWAGGSYEGTITHAQAGRLVLIQGKTQNAAWKRLERLAAKLATGYVGMHGARARFLRLYPEGFASAAFICQERRDKLQAVALLKEAAPLKEARQGSGFGPRIIPALGRADMLHHIQKGRLLAVLSGPDGDAFVRAAAGFALGEGAAALAEMQRILAPHGCANWSAVTYLPLLWRPDTHIIVNPTAMQDFGYRVGHPFGPAYHSWLDTRVYDSLLDLAAQTKAALHDLGPRDNIDVQGFIWVINHDGRPLAATVPAP